MQLEDIMLSKVSQDQKHKGHVFLLEAHMSKKRKPLKKNDRLMMYVLYKNKYRIFKPVEIITRRRLR
jgi:hypothetical protein